MQRHCRNSLESNKFQCRKRNHPPHWFSDKGLKGTVVYGMQTCHSRNVVSLEITFTVPLMIQSIKVLKLLLYSRFMFAWPLILPEGLLLGNHILTVIFDNFCIQSFPINMLFDSRCIFVVVLNCISNRNSGRFAPFFRGF